MICRGKGFKVIAKQVLFRSHRDFVLFVGDALLTFGAFTVPGWTFVVAAVWLSLLLWSLDFTSSFSSLGESFLLKVFVLMRERACRGTQRRSSGSHWILAGQAWKRRGQRRSCWSPPAPLGSSPIPPFQLGPRPGLTIFVTAQESILFF